MGIIFNSVNTFVEQIGRRQVWKFAELDNMITIFNGPQAQALRFKPKVNDRHPQYPLMFCTDAEIVDEAATIAEIRATYLGIIQSGGASSFNTDPIVSVTPVQGSRDFIKLYMVQVAPAAMVLVPQPGTPVFATQWSPLYDAGTRNLNIRYIGTQCTVRYHRYPSPGGLQFSHLGMSKVKWSILSEYLGPFSPVIRSTVPSIANAWFAEQNVLPPTIFATNLGFSYEPRSAQWYTCTEIYGPTF